MINSSVPLVTTNFDESLENAVTDGFPAKVFYRRDLVGFERSIHPGEAFSLLKLHGGIGPCGADELVLDCHAEKASNKDYERELREVGLMIRRNGFQVLFFWGVAQART